MNVTFRDRKIKLNSVSKYKVEGDKETKTIYIGKNEETQEKTLVFLFKRELIGDQEDNDVQHLHLTKAAVALLAVALNNMTEELKEECEKELLEISDEVIISKEPKPNDTRPTTGEGDE
jgi:hypothetical protein